jgi:hypothetical protein
VYGEGYKNMSAPNLKQKDIVKKSATEAEMSATNMGMQDRIKIDNVLGTLKSTEKDAKKGRKDLIGPQ